MKLLIIEDDAETAHSIASELKVRGHDAAPDITFDFVKLFEVTEVEPAQIRMADAQTGSLLIHGGVVDPAEERARVAKDPDGIVTSPCSERKASAA